MPYFRIQQAANQLRQGGIVAYPTEAVWGLGCDPYNLPSVLRLLQLKQRPLHKGLILVAADISQFDCFLSQLNNAQRAELDASWPGPNTWLVPSNKNVPNWISGGQPTVALRVSAHPVIQELCYAFGGPIVSTSANTSGQRPAKSVLDVRRYFSPNNVTLVPGVLGGLSAPTTIKCLKSGNIIRA